MHVDTDALGAVRTIAVDGARHAADSLYELTGVETRVETTSVTLISRESARERFSRSMTGVELEFEGSLSGQTTLVFDRDRARFPRRVGARDGGRGDRKRDRGVRLDHAQ
ncbi:hypothetical protein [Halalkalicoccus subterraneus]|uniref:hypothetical protein n=1 Tax=Halalkalicoccus subterraneus TaxID=2675002 RepID=UPI001FEA4CF1|nr:hypothetical protein [Halalkalicoccus subterraneus]